MLARFLFRAWKVRRRDHRAELAALSRGIAPGELAIDAGACKGSSPYTLADHRLLLALDCEERHLGAGGVARPFAWLRERGHGGDFVERGKPRPLSEFGPPRHQCQGPGALWNEAGYCINFMLRSGGRGAGVAQPGAV